LAFQNFTSDNFLAGGKRFKLNHFHKRICFKDNSTLLIADERIKTGVSFMKQLYRNTALKSVFWLVS
jgi:hypothetical protein